MKALYSLLDIPWVYKLSQLILAPGKPWMMRKVFRRAFPASKGVVLDVGCGPKLITTEPEGWLVGVDINEAFIREYTGGDLDQDPSLPLHPPTARKRLGYVAPADKMPFADGTFDEARAVGFLHHLNDGELAGAIREMVRCLRKGGRLVVLEDVWPLRAWTRPAAWLIRRFDRGRHMRTQAQLGELFRRVCPGEWKEERFTYALTGQELAYLEFTKS